MTVEEKIVNGIELTPKEVVQYCNPKLNCAVCSDNEVSNELKKLSSALRFRSILSIDNRLFAVEFGFRDLTAPTVLEDGTTNMDNVVYTQPYEVYKHEYVVTEYLPMKE